MLIRYQQRHELWVKSPRALTLAIVGVAAAGAVLFIAWRMSQPPAMAIGSNGGSASVPIL